MEGSSGKIGKDVPVSKRPLRADARRNVETLLEAAKTVFSRSGVDAPAKEIADLAGVGVGTLYRHFPRRADLIKAHVEHEIDARADAAPALLAKYKPSAALSRWLLEYADLLATKPRLASALHSGDPAFDGLPDYFWQRLGPTLETLLAAAVASGEIRADVSARDILSAIAHLSHTGPQEDAGYSQRMVAVLIDGLRYRSDAHAQEQRRSTQN